MLRKEVLISIKTFSGKGLERLSEALVQLEKFIQVEKLSSVFKVSRTAESFMSIAMVDGEEQLEGFAVVVAGVYSDSTHKLAEIMSELEQGLTDQVTRRVISINILAVKGEILKTPRLTLPHPEFHLRPEEIILACELWPDYEHPILGKPIKEIAQELPDKAWGEFHCQGQALVAKE